MNKIPHFCTNCKIKVHSIDELLFVEETTTKGFCSEKCIMQFYTPYLSFFSDLEIKFKESLKIDEFEDYTDMYSDPRLLGDVTDLPDETFEYKDEVEVSYHLHIKYFSKEDIYYIIICTHYDKKPAFIYFKLLTKSLKLVEKYREYFNQSFLESGSSDQGLDAIDIPDDTLEELEQKKSEHLALLIERRKNSDIPFETFNIYDDYLTLTLEDPDQVFHFEDDAGDKLTNYIKTFKKAGQEFYYVVTCSKVEIKDKELTKLALLPVISFPSIDKELYKYYAIGESKTSRLKN